MKKIIILILMATLMMAGCEKRDEKQVKYVATGAISEFTIKYRDKDGIVKTEIFEAQSTLDEWVYSFVEEQGEIVYASGFYKDISSGLKIMILVNGKVYKQASSLGDTINYLTVSGVIPY
jgi:uncharacterized lipoprotein NlpE involved in copper resistance